MCKPFTVCCLFYGDYPKLAERLLQSLYRLQSGEQYDLRVGLNAVSVATADIVKQYAEMMPMQALLGDPPYYKYPLMRRLFHQQPIETPFTMWFDDDSWLRESATARFFPAVVDAMQVADMLGAMYYWPHLTANERRFIEDQPWYTGVSIPGTVPFITGGWWVIRTAILQQHRWPIDELQHDGGDVMLGEMCHQQGYRMAEWKKDVAINADDRGRCSRAPRRGASGKTPRCGRAYQRPQR